MPSSTLFYDFPMFKLLIVLCRASRKAFLALHRAGCPNEEIQTRARR